MSNAVAVLVRNMILMLQFSDSNLERDSGILWTEQKSFDRLGLSAAMPTPTCMHKKCIPYKVHAHVSKQSQLYSRQSTEHSNSSLLCVLREPTLQKFVKFAI